METPLLFGHPGLILILNQNTFGISQDGNPGALILEMYS